MSLGYGTPGVTTPLPIAVEVVRDDSGGDGLSVRVQGDAFPRFLVKADGAIELGGGDADTDVDLVRTAPSELQLRDTLRFDRSAAATRTFTVRVSGDANVRGAIRADGRIEWGDGSASPDTNLYREGVDVLATDDKLHVVLELEVDGALNHDGTTVGLYGVTPTVRAAAIAAVTGTADLVYSQAEVDMLNGLVTAVNSIRTALSNIGITNP